MGRPMEQRHRATPRFPIFCARQLAACRLQYQKSHTIGDNREGESSMNRKQILRLCGLWFVLLTVGVASALVMTQDKGTWPADWPKALEPLRANARTIEVANGTQENVYEITFTDRDTFEKIWPTILALKTPGAPL